MFDPAWDLFVTFSPALHARSERLDLEWWEVAWIVGFAAVVTAIGFFNEWLDEYMAERSGPEPTPDKSGYIHPPTTRRAILQRR